MAHPRTAYELSQSQVTTPEPVISLFWKLTAKYRSSLGSVLDMGAGDCRFARGGPFETYTGVEIDRRRASVAKPPAHGKIILGCVFEHDAANYDACIGNPPYARHHDIEATWKDRTVAQFERELSISLNKRCNLYIYFLCQALLKSSKNGLIALLIPYEWVSRPSVKGLREYLHDQRWNVYVYRFQMPIFRGVITTASISFIDKAKRNGKWKFYDITPEYRVARRRGITNSRYHVLDYAKRGEIWALRGLSPGSQKIFTLTERERLQAGLKRTDVVPCVTSLRNVPRELTTLTAPSFRKHFVLRGERCWLIRSHEQERSRSLNNYLEGVPRKMRQNYTCRHQRPWFKYAPHPAPQILFSCGFTKFGPKILLNTMGVRAIGCIFGIHSKGKLPLRRLQDFLLKINFEKRIVAHARKLKKVEVKQLNSVLNLFVDQERKGGPEDPRFSKGRGRPS